MDAKMMDRDGRGSSNGESVPLCCEQPEYYAGLWNEKTSKRSYAPLGIPLPVLSHLVAVIVSITTLVLLCTRLPANLASVCHSYNDKAALPPLRDHKNLLPGIIDPTEDIKWDYHCGSERPTPDQARAHGCKFEVSSYTWVPSPCYSQELEDEFLQLGGWKFFKGKEPFEYPLEEIPLEEIKKGIYDNVHTEFAWHVAHCRFSYKKLAMTAKGKLPGWVSELITQGHLDHCADMVRARNSSSIANS